MFFNKGQRTNKFALMNIANQKVKEKNMTEIVKTAVYGPDNYMLRAMEESMVQERVHRFLMYKVDHSIDFTFDRIE
jgi:hypothetical protein